MTTIEDNDIEGNIKKYHVYRDDGKQTCFSSHASLYWTQIDMRNKDKIFVNGDVLLNQRNDENKNTQKNAFRWSGEKEEGKREYDDQII